MAPVIRDAQGDVGGDWVCFARLVLLAFFLARPGAAVLGQEIPAAGLPGLRRPGRGGRLPQQPALLQLGHRPVQAVLEPSLVDQQPVERPQLIEVLHDAPVDRPGLLLGAGCRPARLVALQDHVLLVLLRPDPLFLLLGQEAHPRPLQPLCPSRPPAKAHDPLRQHGLDLSRRGQLGQHRLPPEGEPVRILSLDDDLLGQEALLDGVLRDDGLARGRPRTGGFLGMGTTGIDLGCGGYRHLSHLAVPQRPPPRGDNMYIIPYHRPKSTSN